jgi:SAM-dependent methyltransferase
MNSRSSYHDYVIKDGRLVGEFEEMYRRFDDPWHHELLNRYSGSRTLAKHQLGILKELNGIRRVLDLGCGKGQFAAEIAQLGLDVTGFDISETAIRKARERSSSARFEIGTLKDRDRILAIQPDVIVMCQITWFVLPELQSFFNFLREKLPNAVILHILAVYAPGDQKYGREYFTDLQEIFNYFSKFGLHYLEYGEIKDFRGAGDTFFLAGWSAEMAARWKQLPNAG